MYPLNKWHKGNPFVWLFLYLVCLAVFAAIGAILAPLNAKVSTVVTSVLDICIPIGLAAIVIVALALLAAALQNKNTQHNQDDNYRKVAKKLNLVLSPISRFPFCYKLPLVFKKLVNVINFNKNSKK